jgi:catechol 2,3-dioxygenase-like lactoylglutathione lyase family enzyme
MTGIQPELWIDRAAEAIAFYGAAFGARVLHQVGEGDDIVAQLAVGDAVFLGFAGRRLRAAVQPADDRGHDRPDPARGGRAGCDVRAGGRGWCDRGIRDG